ncbi:hypothetical protein MCAG_02123 [Micromonospora sp. ATCC 39149]|nr:hypothetical protein MCAG_02123 [Micromonospora sp. ATCC 39149]
MSTCGESFGVEATSDGGADVAVGLLGLAASKGEGGYGVVAADRVGGDHAGHTPGSAVEGGAAGSLSGGGDRVQVRG